MCGIFAHYLYHAPLARQEIVDVVFEALRKLECKGMDSCGVAFAGAQPLLAKAVGGTASLFDKVASAGRDTGGVEGEHISVAHTRWATHGPVTELNAHPIPSDEAHSFLVVHNGIIENHKALKQFLLQQGETFATDTDTEALAKLCKYCFQQAAGSDAEKPESFLALVTRVLKKVHGAYAVVVTSTHFPGEVVASKKGSPLLFAIKRSSAAPAGAAARSRVRLCEMGDMFGPDDFLECVVCSDAAALAEHAADACVLEDGDILSIRGASWTIQNEEMEQWSDGEGSSRHLQRLDACQVSLEAIAKEGFAHYFIKEIHEQPETLTMTMQGRVKWGLPGEAGESDGSVLLGGLKDFVPAILRSRRLLFIASATSFHACLAARPLVESLSEIPVTLEFASDFLDRQGPIFRDDICVFVSQSGETADVVQALQHAKASGALCIGITNGVGSPVARNTEAGMYLHAGPEMGVASTKTYTAQILAISLLALALGENSRAKRAEVQATICALRSLPAAVAAALQLDGQMRALAEELKGHKSLLFFGRGSGFATALEAAHKMKEVAQIHSEGILAGELKHGALALVDEHIPCVVVATRDSMHGKMLSVIQQLKARQGRLIVLCTAGDTAIHEIMEGTLNSAVLHVPHIINPLQQIVNVIPLQLLSYHLTIARCLNVDQPRNLAKAYANAAY